ncbi:HAD family hydrolase [Candidatus Woesearchaeota archaeon]|nr:HAD family hydrolase [Candidatus Woesearchaeota archaeon]
MVKAVIFDFWGTLVENGVWSPIKQVQQILDINMPFSEYVGRMEQAMMTKKFNSLREAFEAVCEEFKVECNEEKMEALIGMWNKSWMLAKPYEEVQEELGKLKEEYKLILVSNTDNFSINQVLDKFQLREYFDHVFLSYEVGLLKTDPKFLKKVLKETKLAAEDCVLVGDSILSDMEAAREAGIKSVLMDHKQRQHFQPKIRNLKELSSILSQ